MTGVQACALPIYDKHVMYVWLDALMNYVTALGYGKDDANMNFLPASTHFVGKDILPFTAPLPASTAEAHFITSTCEALSIGTAFHFASPASPEIIGIPFHKSKTRLPAP